MRGGDPDLVYSDLPSPVVEPAGDGHHSAHDWHEHLVTARRIGVHESPHGEFCAVNASVANHGNKAQMFDASQVQGFIGDSKYEAHSGASMMANPNTDTFLNNINPGNSIKAIVLIDVRVGKQLDKVELHDSLFSAGTSVSVK